ncbi:unnamed protein product [Pieris brassicae]|uniref:Uncharacterized protein n=1 Tax=Pieris brassicae TaxID=7116 RepID=A0A9P0TCP7_PIEBR|nr:unnamed protein product [Pieris brassicae]
MLRLAFFIIFSVHCASVSECESVRKDKLLHHSEHVKSPFLFIRTSDVAFPKYSEEQGNIITAIEITDRNQDGASAEIDYGGVGYNYVNDFVSYSNNKNAGRVFLVERFRGVVTSRACLPQWDRHLRGALACHDWMSREDLCVNGDEVYGNIFPEVEVNENELDSLFQKTKPMQSTFHRVTKKYQCMLDGYDSSSVPLLYGSKAWTFPRQDVNLVLKYPTAGNLSDYCITKVTVILYLDGPRSRGYIKEGGILDNHIEMNFIVENTTRLAYQFWLNGAPASELDLHYQHYRKLC